MAGDTFNTRFLYTASGLPAILSEFKAAAAQITAQAASIGKVNFSGMNAALPVLRNIDNTLLLMAEHANLLSSSGSKLGQVFTPMSAGATKASTATKSVTTSMTQLQAISGQVSSSAAKVTSSMSAMGAAGKAAIGGVVSAGERAIATMSALSAATMSVGRSMARMGTLAAIPMAGMRGISGAVTGSLLASSAAMLLNPFNAVPLVGGYGAYTGMNIEKWASEAAAKSWKPGMTKADSDLIKQYTQQLARSQTGTSVYSPTDFSKAIAEYAGMGGNVTPGTPNALTQSMLKGFSQYAQAINSEDIGTSLNTLVSQNLTWFGLKKAFVEENLKYTENLMASLVATTKAKDTDLAPLLKDVSAVAKTYGRTQTETYAMTASLYQLGLQPQQAGMAYRRILLRGTPNVSDLNKQEAYNMGITNEKGQIIDEETGKAVTLSYVNQALQDLGLTWKDINPETYGEMGSLGVIDKINQKFDEKQYSDIDRQAWAKTVYGLQGSTPFAMLGQNPDLAMEYFKIFTESQKGLGAASEMSAIQVDNLEGSLNFLKTAFQGTAASISDYTNPSLRKFSDFLTTTAVPGLNALGGALASGDWEGVADIAGSAIDFLGEKFASSDDTLTSWINNGIDGLDEFSQRFADFTSGGGVGDLLGGFGEWAQNIWDGIDWGQVDTITSNLSTAFNAAWDQSMAWLGTSIDNVDWSNLGTRAGEALEGAGLWILNKIGELPWSELTTAATNALTGIIVKIDWAAVVSGAVNVGGQIGSAIYSGVSSANLGVLFQNWAIQFQNSMGMAIAGVAASLAGLSAQMGVPTATIQSFVDTSIQEGKSLLATGKEVASVVTDPNGIYNAIHSTNTQGEYTGQGDLLYYNNGTLTLKNPLTPVPEDNRVNSESISDAITNSIESGWNYLFGKNQESLIASGEIGPSPTIYPMGFGEGLPSSEQIQDRYPYLGAEASSRLNKMLDVLRTDQSAEGYYVTVEEAQRTGKTANMCIQASDKALDALEAAGFGPYAALITNPSLVPGDEGHARVAIDPTGNFAPDTTFAVNTTPHTGGGGTDDFEGTFKEEMASLIYPDKLEWDFYKNPVVGEDPRQLFGNPDFSFTPQQIKRLSQVFTTELKDSITGEIIKSGQPYYYGEGASGEVLRDKVYSTDTASLYLNKEDLKNLKFNSGSPIAAAFDAQAAMGQKGSGTVDVTKSDWAKSKSDTESAISSALKKSKGGYEPGASDSNNNDNSRKSRQQSLDKIADNTAQTYTLLEGTNAQGQSITSQYYKNPEDAAFIKSQLESQGYTVSSKETTIKPDYTIKNTKVTEEQTVAATESTKATSESTNAVSSLTGELAAFGSLINSGDYAGISQLIKDKYAFDNPATIEDEREGVWTAQDWMNADAKTGDKSDIDSALSTYLSVLKATQNPFIVPEVIKAVEETAKNTKASVWSDPLAVFKTIKDAFSDATYDTAKAVESTTSAVQSASDQASTQAKVDSSLQQLLYSTICDIEGFFTPERVTPLGTFTSPTGGQLVRVADTWMTKDEYEATIGVPLWMEQMNAAYSVGKTPFAGSITPEDIPAILADRELRSPEAQAKGDQALSNYQNGLTTYDLNLPETFPAPKGTSILQLGGDQSTNFSPGSIRLGALADNGIMEVPIDPVINSEPIDNLKSTTDAGLPYDVKVTSNADIVAAQLEALGGSTSFTVYVSTVRGGSGQTTDFANGTSTLADGSIFSFGGFNTPSIPAFAEGGYTGSYEGPASIHPHEVVLNAAQQRNVAGAIGGERSISITLDLRGAVITGDSAESFANKVAEKVKNSLQDESYR